MTYITAATRTRGYQMSDREPSKGRKPAHGFIPAEQYIREQPLCASLQGLTVHHAIDTKVWRGQHSLEETAIALFLLSKNRPKPPLKNRQTTAAMPEEDVQT